MEGYRAPLLVRTRVAVRNAKQLAEQIIEVCTYSNCFGLIACIY